MMSGELVQSIFTTIKEADISLGVVIECIDQNH